MNDAGALRWTERWIDLPGPESRRLWSEGLGDPAQPVVLLVMGAMNQSIVWPDAFCTEIASAGFCVVRYDHRDTGRSTVSSYPIQPYGLEALTADARAVARAWSGARPAHWIGMSLGGVLAQMAALGMGNDAQTSDTHGARSVCSLTLMMSTPDLTVATSASAGLPPTQTALPPPEPAYLQHLRTNLYRPVHTTSAMLEHMVDGWRAANGSAPDFDSDAARQLMQRALMRTDHPLHALRHLAATASARDLSDLLKSLRLPTLVVHGALDPLLPPAHGAALSRLIAGAALLQVQNMGHVFDRRHLDVVAPRIILHLQQAIRTMALSDAGLA